MHTLLSLNPVCHSPPKALLDKEEGVGQLKALSEKSKLPELPHVCSAEVYDGLFARVRKQVRAGVSNREIQKLLDADYVSMQEKHS